MANAREPERELRRAVVFAPFLSLRDIFPPWGARNPGLVSTSAIQSKPLPLPNRLSFPSSGGKVLSESEAERGLVEVIFITLSARLSR